MIYIEQNQNNTIALTLTESATITNDNGLTLVEEGRMVVEGVSNSIYE